MPGIRDRFTRRLGPRIVIASAGVKPHQRLSAARLRASGGRERVELLMAFDDPLSAFALIDLSRRLGLRRVDLTVHPVVARGMRDDPAVEWKREYALVDAARLAARIGVDFSRTETIRPEAVRYLADWVSAREPHPTVTAFALAAAEAIWVDRVDPVDSIAFARLWEELIGGSPPGPGTGRVERNEALMARRGPYDVPAAWIRGQWFFAHERGERIAQTLDQLGWRVGE